MARTLRARHHLLDDWKKKCESARDVTKKLVWFHAPSVGEGLQARPVIDLLRTTHPDVQIAYSFFSPSAEKFAASLNADVSGYLPFDSIHAARTMLDALKPSVLVFAKLDVWPNLVCVAAERGVRTALLSATMAPGSGRQGAFAKALLRDAYAALDVVGAIDAENAARLAQLGVHNDRVQVSGDTRFDQVFARAQHVDRLTALLQSLQSDRPTLVAGSTWPADEEVLLPAWVEIKARIPSVRIIIAPHEPTPAHVGPIQDWAKQHKLSAATLTELSGRTNGDVDVIIVDRVGVLGDIYAIADVAFVGGAFHRAGLHSVIEPAAFGTPVVFGPAYQMSREAGLLLNRGGAVSVSSREQCVAALFSYFSDDAGRTRAGVNAKAVVESELGAAQRSLHLLIGLLRRS